MTALGSASGLQLKDMALEAHIIPHRPDGWCHGMATCCPCDPVSPQHSQRLPVPQVEATLRFMISPRKSHSIASSVFSWFRQLERLAQRPEDRG